MSVSNLLDNYLADQSVQYCVHRHGHSHTALESAHMAHVPPGKVAKAVILHDEKGYLMAVVPADRRVNIGRVNQHLSRHLYLADEPELKQLFRDCECGAVPALADAYSMEAIWDDDLAASDSVYIEAGDHDMLIEISGKDFTRMMYAEPHDRITAKAQH